MKTTTTIRQTDCLTWMKGQADGSVNMTFGSPPYANKGTRYQGQSEKRGTTEWVDWMKPIIHEATRITNGPVFIVASGNIQGGQYQPACEGLIWELYREGTTRIERPVIWHSNKPPSRTSKTDSWFSNAWEQVLCFGRPGSKFHFDWEAIGTPRKYTAGGNFRQRSATGKRTSGSAYPQGKLARPRDVIYITVGGGHLGYDREDDRLASEGEAPYPLKLAQHFIKAASKPGDTIYDPFTGSATTAIAASMLGRNFIGTEAGRTQAKLGRKRYQRYAQTAHTKEKK